MAVPGVVNPPVLNNPQANAVPPARPASTDNYLSRCVEELKPETIAAHESGSTFFKGAAKAFLAFFIIVAIGAFVATGIFAPIYIPIAAIVAFCASPYALQFHDYLINSYSNEMQQEANRLQHIAQKFNELPTEPRLLALKLASIAILWSSIPGVQQFEHLEPLKPLIARYDLCFEQKTLCETRATELRTAIQTLETQAATATEEQRPALAQEIKIHRYNILGAQREALVWKVNAAFVHAVIQRPTFAGEFETLAELVHTDIQDRAVAREFNDAALANNFVKFKQLNVQTLTLDEIKALPITVIAHRFIQAMPQAPAAA